jgi:hypothetical protein
MEDSVVREPLLSHIERILASEHLSPDLREAVMKTHLAIAEAQGLIDRSDQLIRSISKAFAGSPCG